MSSVRARLLNAAGFGFLFSIAAYNPPALAGSNVIVPDGRTSTKLKVFGSVTSISTGTIADGSAFNSFSQFQVGLGNTVNLEIPGSAARLVNIVTGGPVDIEGVLNSYKNGQLGGDVYFADPYGFVVGPSGAVNVGALTVTTPTSSALASAMDGVGNINASAMNNVIVDATPISADGAILVLGRINAQTGVHLHGQTVQVGSASGTQSSSASNNTSQQLFQASVNTKGLQQGAAITVNNGNVEIVADGDASVSGSVAANGSAGQNANQVNVSAGGNVAIAGTANISAAGQGANSSGGAVTVKAGNNLNVGSGATVNVSAGSSGNGGTIELSAVNTANFSQATLNAGATSGTAGSIVIDPTVVNLTGSSVDLPGTNPSIDSNGGTVTITATDSIDLEYGAYINTRQTVLSGSPSADNTTTGPVGASGSVTLNAPSITIDGTIETAALNTLNTSPTSYASGTVTLQAGTGGSITMDSTGTIHTGGAAIEFDAESGSITTGGTIDSGGGSVTLDANTASGSTSVGTVTINGTITSDGGAVIVDAQDGGTAALNTFGYIDSNGGPVTFNVDDGTITVQTGADINTRQTVATGSVPNGPDDASTAPMGNSGAVDFEASTITVAGTIDAAAFNPQNATTIYSDGNITLNAQASDSEIIGKAQATSSVDISGTLEGGTIDVEAGSSAETDMTLLAQAVQDLITSAFGAGAIYIDSQAYSTITVDTGASIKGSGNVTFNSYNTSEAEDPVFTLGALALSQLAGFTAQAVVGNVTAESSATVASGATIDSGGVLTVRSYNSDTLDNSLTTLTFSTPVGASVAYSTGTVTSNATVANGATINASQVNVVSRNDNSFTTSASDDLFGSGQAGIVLAIANGITTTANANFGTSYTAPTTLTGGGDGGLLVEAESNTYNDAVEASSTVGSNAIVRALGTFAAGANALLGATAAVSSAGSLGFDAIVPVKLGAAISLTLDETQSATATLGNTAEVNNAQTPYTPASAATINADQVAVVANTTDAGVRSAASASTNSPSIDDATPENPTAAYSVSASIAYASRDLSSTAVIEPDTVVTAPEIGVESNTILPVTFTWLDFDSLGDILSHINGNVGVADDVTTSFTDATGDAGSAGINGSVDFFDVDASSTAYVGDGAKLTQTGAVAGPWTATLDTGDNSTAGLSGGNADSVTFADSLAVEANRDISAINFGGSVSIFLNGLGGAGVDTASSYGATYNESTYSGSTDAGLGADVTVNTNGNLDVEAAADDQAINVAPAAGRGGGLSVDGMETLFKLDTSVHASIDATDDITASNLTLTATQGESIFTVSGGLFFGNADSVGILLTQNIIDTDVKAYIGSTANDDPFESAIPSSTLNIPTTAGVTATDAVNVTASEDGGAQSLAVEIDAGSNSAIGVASPVSTISDNIGATIDGATVSANDVYLNATADDNIDTIAIGVGSGGTGVTAEGSIAVGLISPTIAASITDGASVTAADNVEVAAENQDTITTLAGELAFGGSSLGVGISVITADIDSSTTASITGSTTFVNANSTDGSDTFAVNSGTLASPPNIDSINAPTVAPSSLSETQTDVHGLAVVATTDQEVIGDAVTLGVSGSGGSGAINLVTTIVNASANAYIQDASVDTELTGDPTKPIVPGTTDEPFSAPELEVIAGNNTSDDDFVAALSESSGLSGSVGTTATQFTGTTKAYTQDAQIGTTTGGESVIGDFDVTALSTQDEADIVISGAAGTSSVGGAGSIIVTLFSADTEAYATGGSITVGDLDVDANSDNGANILGGAGAIGSKGGVGGVFAVTVNNDTTLGYVGDLPDTIASLTNPLAVIDATSLTTGTATVDATTTNDFTNLVIAAGAGFYAGIAAMADVTTMSNTTDAGFYSTGVNNGSGATAAGNITVNAQDSDTIDSTAGDGGAGGVGIGIAANVVVMHASTTGTLLDSNIDSSGTVAVSAEGARDIDVETITGAVGYYAGVSAAAGVILAGTDAESDVQGQISGTVGNADSIASAQGVDGVQNSVDGGSPDAITASIAGGSLTAGTLTVEATGTASSSNDAYGFAAGAFAGVGGAVAYTDMGNTVLATINGTSPTASDITIQSQMNDGTDGSAVSTAAYAGGGGTVGIGAGISVAKMDDTVDASLIGGAMGDTTGALDIVATDDATVSSTAAGGAAGGVAVGVMVATATKNSTVEADTAQTATDETIASFPDITVDATDGGSVSSSSTGVAGGDAGAANAAAATASDTSTVEAFLGSSTEITGMTGTTLVEATDTPNVSADAYGVTVSDGVSLGASVALTNVDPTVYAELGDSVSLSDDTGSLSVSATLTPPVDPTTLAQLTDASSSAFSGTGGAIVALDGAVAQTENNSDVEATTGSGVVLPDGDVSIGAINTSNQNASASGIGVGGIAGGASDAEADTGSKTIATLGADNTAPDHTGSLSVVASGVDTDTSQATAGTYGLITGNASVSDTDDDATVEAIVGADTDLPASTISVKASHQDDYSEDADSSQVSVLGESGAYAKHSADVTVKTIVNDGVDLIAADTVDIDAENDFTNVGTTDSADGGGGGVANGASGGATTDITGNTAVVILNNIVIDAGTDPVENPGYINILADSNVTAADTVSLSTGGVLEGSGATESFSATTNNKVYMGNSDVFLSFGNFDAGTYTDDNVTANALGHTWGILTAVADVYATVSLSSTQNVILGQDSTIEVDGNANITAGQNPATAQGSLMEGSAVAQSWVSGFIAVPTADSSSSATDDTTVKIGTGSVVNAGENATIGGYAGTLSPEDTADGYGYELGFIPVKDGDASTPSTSETQTVVINGAVTAGAFNSPTITIADCGDDTGGYCDEIAVSGNYLSDGTLISPLALYTSDLNPVDFINERVSGTDATLLASTVSNGEVDAIALNTLFASPGVVTINADTLSGTGSLTANGSASITIDNASPDYLITGAMEIANIPGGNVYFTGKANATGTGIAVTQNNTDTTSTITIDDSYTTGSAPSSVVFVNGEIDNLGGSVNISDAAGSLGQFAPIEAQNVVIDVPYGTLVVDLATGVLETTGASVEADWAPFIVLPGDEATAGTDQTKGPFDADLAFAYAVNAVFNPTGQYTTDQALTAAMDNGGTLTGVAGVNYSSSFTDGKGSDGQAFLAYGTCYPGIHSGQNCGDSGNGGALNQSYSPVDALWGSNWSDLSRQLSLVPVETLTYSLSCSTTPAACATPPAASTTTSSVSAIVANTIAITASYIDVDSNVTAGPPTDWSVDLSSSVATQITADQLAYQQGTHGASFSLTGVAGVSTVGADDSLINVTYEAGATPAAGQIIVNNVLAAAQEAASITLDGDILSTNTLGDLHVNAGLGQVTIDNETGTAITVNNVEAGNASRLGGVSGAIEIVDTEKPVGDASDPDHYWYEFTPGAGTTIYESGDPTLSASPFTPNANAVNEGTSTATSFDYDPVSGLRWEWSEMSFMQRTVTLSSSQSGDPTTTHWFFTDPDGTSLGLNDNNPWYYVDTVDTQSAVTAGSGLYYYNPGAVAFNPVTGTFYTPTSGVVLTQNPANAGSLVVDPGLPTMQETITGTVTPTLVQAVDSDCVYGAPHCGNQGGSPSAFDSFHGVHASTFQLGNVKFLEDNGDFDFDYLTQGTVTVTVSVAADNPIGVTFSGSSTGSVTINSNAAVTLNGQIENPNGTTTINSTSGGVATTPDGAVVTQNLTLNTSGTNGSIGTVANPLTTTQTANGALNASGETGVYIAATGGLNIGQIESTAGDVVLSAQGDIMRTGTPSPANVIGNNVTLTATNDGSIGTSAAPIQTEASGAVNITADGNVAIEQTQGNLYAGTIQSVGIGGTLGNVQVTVDNGALLDAASTTQTQALSLDQQEAIWAKLKLTVADGGGVNSGAGAPTVTAISSTVDSDYQQYWMLLSQGTVQNGSYVLNAGSVSLFQQIATAAGETPQAYTAQLYANAVSDFVQYIGANWQSQGAFQSQVSNFAFTPSQTQINNLTANATETEGQLESALSVTALQPSSGTSVGTTTPNISGGTVTLWASDGIGSLAAPVTITLADLTSGNLTTEQEAAIGLASNPGAILFTGTNAQGQTVQFSGTIPAGVTLTGVSIGQTAPLFVAASGTFDATAPDGGVFAQATAGDLNIGSVNAQAGEVNLTAPGNILAANAGNAAIITASGITLLAGDNIGTSTTPIVYTGPAGAVLSSASAGDDIYLDASGIDMLVGRIFAGGDAVLDAPQGSIEPTLAGIALDADNLTLTAEDNIGSPSQAFEVQLTEGGQLNATAGGAANLTGVGDLDVGTLTTYGDLEVTATGNLVADTLTSTAGSVSAAAGIDDTLTTVNADTTTTLTAVGDLTLDDVTSGSDMTLGSGGALVLDANGTLTSGGDLTVTQASSITMDAGSTMSAPGDLSLTTSGDATLTTATASGNATVDAGGDVAIASLTSGGTLTVDAGGALTADTLQSASDLVLTSGGDLSATTLASTSGNATLTSGADAAVASVTADQVTISSGGALTLTDVTASGAASLSSGSTTTLGPDGSIQAASLTVPGAGAFVMDDGSTVSSAGAIDIDAGAFTMDANTTMTSGGNFTLDTTGDALLTDVIVGGATDITTGGSLTIDPLTSTGPIDLDTGGPILITGDVTTSSTLTVGGPSLTMGTNTLLEGDGVTIAVTGPAILGEVESTLNAPNALTVSAETITGNGDGQPNLVATGPDATIMLTAQDGIGSSSAPLIIDAPEISLSTQSGDIALDALTSMTFGNIAAPADLDITGNGDLAFGDVSAAGNVNLSAAGDLTFDTIDATGNATLDAGGGLSGGSVTATNLTINAGSLSLAKVVGQNLSFSAQGDLDIQELVVGESVSLSGLDILANLTQPASSTPLKVSISGPNGEATDVTLNIDAPAGVVFPIYAAENGTITTTAADVDILDGYVSGQLFLFTPFTTLYLNDQSPTPVSGFAEQFYAPGDAFFLYQDRASTFTNAYAVDFGPGVNTMYVAPDGRVYDGFSLVETAPLALYTPSNEKTLATEGLADGTDEVMGKAWISNAWDADNLALFDLWVLATGGQVAVNLGTAQP